MVGLPVDNKQADNKRPGEVRHDQRVQIGLVSRIQDCEIIFEFNIGNQQSQAKEINKDIDDIRFLFHIAHLPLIIEICSDEIMNSII